MGLLLLVSLTFTGHQGEFRTGALYLRHVKLQLREQVVFCLVEDVNGGQCETARVCKHHPLFLPLLPSWSTHDLGAGRGVPGHQLDIRQAGSQGLHALQQWVVIATEEGVQRRRVGQEDADGHSDGWDEDPEVSGCSLAYDKVKHHYMYHYFYFCTTLLIPD